MLAQQQPIVVKTIVVSDNSKCSASPLVHRPCVEGGWTRRRAVVECVSDEVPQQMSYGDAAVVPFFNY
jgi:hypothetical protein